MAKFEIENCDYVKSKQVESPGIAEAMLEVLPWPTLDIRICWSPSNGSYDITDNKTGFKYKAKLL